jgi:glutamate/tyrosine decarboxylase-like PLP-dependent enzyme
VDMERWLSRGLAAIEDWQDSFGPFDRDPSLRVSDEQFAGAFDDFTRRLGDNYPFFHPSYAGQMLKPPHPAAVVGYLTAMLINPNNHALDGGPATARMEKEVVAQLAGMFGLGTHLGHLTTSGTIANLEALYVARELHPGSGVAYSTEAHYTHGRMCGVLGVEGTPVGVDGAGRLDLAALDDLLAGGRIGTVVATAGTTGLGAIDPVHKVLAIARRHGVRVHVDAAYGGFFTLLAGAGDGVGNDDGDGGGDDGEGSHRDGGPGDGGGNGSGADRGDAGGRARLDPAPWRAIAECDSVVVDPHKHGLQPYGCGAVLFRDPVVGRLYRHDSPYTYFTSDELHLGEISLECSRAGAAAAALWLTFRLLPPTPDGLGKVLAACRRAALDWSELIEAAGSLTLYQPPELDIVCYFPAAGPLSLSAIDQASARMMAAGMADRADPVFLSTLQVTAGEFARRHPAVTADRDGARILRSVLMKPEAQSHVARLHARVEQLAAG